MSKVDVQKMIKITDEDRGRFIKCLIEGQPFSKSYKCLGGLIEVTFKEPTLIESRVAAQSAQLGEFSHADALFLVCIEKVVFLNELSNKEPLVFGSDSCSVLLRDAQPIGTTLVTKCTKLSQEIFHTVDRFSIVQRVFREEFMPYVKAMYDQLGNPDFFSKTNCS